MSSYTSPRAGSRYTDLPRPSTPVSTTSRSPMYPSTTTRPSGDVLQGGSAFGLATPTWRQGPDSEWRSSRNRINPNPALTAPSTPRSGSLSLTFPRTKPSGMMDSKVNVDLPPRKGDLFRRAGESNELLPPPRVESTIRPASPPAQESSHYIMPETTRGPHSLPSTPSRTPVTPSLRDTQHPPHHNHNNSRSSSKLPERPSPIPEAASQPTSSATPPLIAETSARTPLPERGRPSSSPRDVSVLAPPLPSTPRPPRAADNSYHEPAKEEKRHQTDLPRAPIATSRSSAPTTPRRAAATVASPSPATATHSSPRMPITNERTVSMSHSASSDTRRYLIPPQRDQDTGKLVVVLDLDETLVYSREGGIFQRPGVKNLLEVLKGRCELIVWTAGVRDYALEAIQLIDTCCAVQHCIYRHPMWFTNDVACPKDLRLLGRPLDSVVIVDNTPDVFRLNPDNAILVTDFLGKASCNRGEPDRTLTTLAAIFDHVLSHFPAPRASHILASKRILRRNIKTDAGVTLSLPTLKHDRIEDLQCEHVFTPSSLAVRFAMLRYMNRGNHLNT